MSKDPGAEVWLDLEPGVWQGVTGLCADFSEGSVCLGKMSPFEWEGTGLTAVNGSKFLASMLATRAFWLTL